MAWAERAEAGDVGGASRRFGEGAVVEDPFQLDDDGLEDFVLKHRAAGAFRQMLFEEADDSLPYTGVMAGIRWEKGPGRTTKMSNFLCPSSLCPISTLSNERMSKTAMSNIMSNFRRPSSVNRRKSSIVGRRFIFEDKTNSFFSSVVGQPTTVVDRRSSVYIER